MEAGGHLLDLLLSELIETTMIIQAFVIAFCRMIEKTEMFLPH